MCLLPLALANSTICDNCHTNKTSLEYLKVRRWFCENVLGFEMILRYIAVFGNDCRLNFWVSICSWVVFLGFDTVFSCLSVVYLNLVFQRTELPQIIKTNRAQVRPLFSLLEQDFLLDACQSTKVQKWEFQMKPKENGMRFSFHGYEKRVRLQDMLIFLKCALIVPN